MTTVASISTEAGQRAHYAAIRARLFNAKPRPANTNIRTKPVVEVKPVKAPQIPLWERQSIHFDAHVDTYYRMRSILQNVAGFSMSTNIVIGDVATKPARRFTMDIIKDVLEDFPGITVDLVKGRRRTRNIVAARYACMRAVHRERPDMSFPQIGRIFNKDHSVVMYAVGKHKNRKPSAAVVAAGNLEAVE